MRLPTRTLVALGIAACSAPLDAQRTWPERGVPPIVGLDIATGVYAPIESSGGPMRFGARTATYSLSTWIPFRRRMALTAELPVSIVEFGEGPSRQAATAIGDPWVGMELRLNPDIVLEFGVRPGLASPRGNLADSLARANGVAADYDHYEAWREGHGAIRSTIHVDRRLSSTWFMGGLVGASASLSRVGMSEASREYLMQRSPWLELPPQRQIVDAYLLYGLRAGRRDSTIEASVAFIGRAYPTAHGALSEPYVHQFALDIARGSGRVRPSASIRFYQDRYLQKRSPLVATIGFRVWR